MQLFLTAIRVECNLLSPRTLAKQRIEIGLLTERVRASKVVIAKIMDITDQNRNIQIGLRDIHEKHEEIRRIEDSIQTKRAEVNQSVLALSMLIYQLNGREADDHVEEIFMEEEENEQGVMRRRDLGEMTKMIKLLYTVDPLEPLNPEMMEVVRNATPEFGPN